ncbi:MAG: hypothetical protein PHR44_05765 [Candidatus Omnitrophica bacterium]|nr:hypothetical protein [Candidatus Omnitrophota bacterium]
MAEDKTSTVFIAVISLAMIVIEGCSAAGPMGKPSIALKKEYIQSQPALSPETKKAIIEGRVIRGMTKVDVRASWGAPNDIYYYSKDQIREDGNRKDYDFWYYKGALLQTLAPNCTVTFKDGIVEDIFCGSWYTK